eukprot:scaffold34652_cov211-Amphora_coffeaeformis.AAC.2
MKRAAPTGVGSRFQPNVGTISFTVEMTLFVFHPLDLLEVIPCIPRRKPQGPPRGRGICTPRRSNVQDGLPASSRLWMKHYPIYFFSFDSEHELCSTAYFSVVSRSFWRSRMSKPAAKVYLANSYCVVCVCEEFVEKEFSNSSHTLH